MSCSVGVVLPAYRPDTDQLRTYIDAIHDFLAPQTIVVELDAPQDGVPEQFSSVPAEVHTVPYRRGKGAAITAGFERLETDVLAFVDADGSTPVASLGRVLEPVTGDRTDLAVGSRRHPDAIVASHQTFARRFLGDGFAWLASQLLDASLYDYQCGAKAISATAWARIRDHLYEPGFAWDVELIAIAAAKDLRIAEVPIEWEDQPGSTVSPIRTSLDLFQALLTARHRSKQLRNDGLHAALSEHLDDSTALVEKGR
ncbi:MAG: glycosyltransferase [Haloarcula sp.]